MRFVNLGGGLAQLCLPGMPCKRARGTMEPSRHEMRTDAQAASQVDEEDSPCPCKMHNRFVVVGDIYCRRLAKWHSPNTATESKHYASDRSDQAVQHDPFSQCEHGADRPSRMAMSSCGRRVAPRPSTCAASRIGIARYTSHGSTSNDLSRQFSSATDSSLTLVQTALVQT